MGLWGNTDADESLPKWTLGNQKLRNDIYATPKGWVHRHADGYEEVLACVKALNGTALSGESGLKVPEVVGLEYVGDAPTNAAGAGIVRIDVAFNEAVIVVVGSGITATATGSTTGDITLTYSGTGSAANTMRFETTAATLTATETITVLKTDSVLVLASGASIKDSDDNNVTLTTVLATQQTVTVVAA